MTDRWIAWLGHWIILLIQSLPLRLVARCGRVGGMIAWWFDARHRKVMLANLSACFPLKSPNEIRQIARENMRRLGENYASAVKTAAMPSRQVEDICAIEGAEKIRSLAAQKASKNYVVAIGHFGNFELNALLASQVPSLKPATTYRGLNQPVLNELMQMIRERSGCMFFERRSDAKALRNALNEGGVLLGLLSDQHAGNNGLRTPFLGRDCSTTTAPALLSLRYDGALFTAICFRTTLARWKIEIGDRIPTHENGKPRSIQSITEDINRALETAVLRDPANWFWVHNRWKTRPVKQNPIHSTEASLPADPVVEIESP